MSFFESRARYPLMQSQQRQYALDRLGDHPEDLMQEAYSLKTRHSQVATGTIQPL